MNSMMPKGLVDEPRGPSHANPVGIIEFNEKDFREMERTWESTTFSTVPPTRTPARLYVIIFRW